jgi:hypothetical protein
MNQDSIDLLGDSPKKEKPITERDREKSFVMANGITWKGKKLHPYSAVRHWMMAEFASRVKSRSNVGDGYLIFFLLSHPVEFLEKALQSSLTQGQMRELITRTVEAKCETNGDIHEIGALASQVLEEVFNLKASPIDQDDDDEDESGNVPGQSG